MNAMNAASAAKSTSLVVSTRTPVRRTRRYREFLPAALEIIETPPSPIGVVLLYTIAALLAAILAWSYFGHLDVYATAPGKIQPTGRTKVVQPIEPGKVVAVHVSNGSRVTQGDVLIELDPSVATATRTAASDKLVDLRAEIKRRNAAVAAAISGDMQPAPKIEWEDDIPSSARSREEHVLRADLASLATSLAALTAQRRQKEVERDKYQADIDSLNTLLALLSERASMNEKLFERNVSSRLQVIDAQQSVKQTETKLVSLKGSLSEANSAIDVIDSEIAKTREGFLTDNTEKLALAERSAEDQAQEFAKATVRLQHMYLNAPISGTVEALTVTSIGQVVTTGQELLRVVDDGAPLEIEAYVLNQDVGFVAPGQEATIKVDAFPYTRYGTIAGTVTKVAADAIPGIQAAQNQHDPNRPPSGTLSATSAAERTQDLVFPVLVAPSSTVMDIEGKQIPLSSGMTVAVDIKTESRRAIDYVLSPLRDIGSTAMRER
jgi:hemolysin D